MSGSDYTVYSDLLGVEMSKHVVVLKRYDDNGGTWASQVSFWPEKIMFDGWLPSFHRPRLLTDHERFRKDLIEHGFVCREYADIPEGFQKEIVAQAVPLEWKSCMDLMGARIQVYSNWMPQLTRMRHTKRRRVRHG